MITHRQTDRQTDRKDTETASIRDQALNCWQLLKIYV